MPPVNRRRPPRRTAASTQPNPLFVPPAATPQPLPHDFRQAADSMLAPFGLQLPDPRQNIMLPEPGTDNFFGQHPNLSRGIENALLMGASVGPSETPGDAINQVARALLSLDPQRMAIQQQRQMQPFEMLAPMLNIQKAQADLANTAAQTDLYKQHGELYDRQAEALLAPAVPKFSNVRTLTDGRRVGINDQTGREEIVPMADGIDPKMFGSDSERTLFERLLNSLESEAGRSFTAEEKWQKYLQFNAQRAGAAAGAAQDVRESGEGFVSPAARLMFDANFSVAREELKKAEGELAELNDVKKRLSKRIKESDLPALRKTYQERIARIRRGLSSYPQAFLTNPSLDFDTHINSSSPAIDSLPTNPYRNKAKR